MDSSQGLQSLEGSKKGLRPGGTLGKGGRRLRGRSRPGGVHVFLPSLRDGAYFYAPPGTEVPGYYQLPLRGKDGSPRMLLDKMWVRVKGFTLG
jgi:hypothetical protein